MQQCNSRILARKIKSLFTQQKNNLLRKINTCTSRLIFEMLSRATAHSKKCNVYIVYTWFTYLFSPLKQIVKFDFIFGIYIQRKILTL